MQTKLLKGAVIKHNEFEKGFLIWVKRIEVVDKHSAVLNVVCYCNNRNNKILKCLSSLLKSKELRNF